MGARDHIHLCESYTRNPRFKVDVFGGVNVMSFLPGVI